MSALVNQRESQSEPERVRESQSEPEPELLLLACINCSGALKNLGMHYNKLYN